ncbi:MAG: VanZ family protein [Ruminococcus sp.]|nr:VanZ family protein [Ruminococcus sp.]MCR4639316.1 VanZ family protein [Ruminococcus sp.]
MRIKSIIVFTLFAVYLICAVFMLFFMRESLLGICSYREYFRENTNFVPFRTIIEFAGYLRDGDTLYGDISFENIFGNLAAFLPTGVLFPAIWRKQRRFRSFLLTASAAITGVEMIQFITMCGACDIDDFILNLTGAVIGFGFSRLDIVKKLMFTDVGLKKGE